MYCSGVGVTGRDDGWERMPGGGGGLPAVSQQPLAAAAAVMVDWHVQKDPPWRPTVLEISSPGQKKVSRSQTFSEGPMWPHKGPQSPDSRQITHSGSVCNQNQEQSPIV
jgi:hypothetical protein